MTAASVCIPTYGRPDRLQRALLALQQVEAPEGGFEIVVADDGSPQAQRVVAAVDSVRDGPVPVRLVRSEQNRGPAAARNQAWREATGAWIAFTDDDCQVAADWLIRLLERAEETGATVVQGRTVPDPDRADLLSRPWSRSVHVEQPDGYFQTCNIAYRRDLLAELGGFDETFRLIGDDTDLGWRAEQAGSLIAFAPDALVTHEVVVSDWRSDLRSRRRWTDTVRVIAKHPASRSLSWHPYVFRPSHVPILALAVASPLALHRRGRRILAGGVGAALAVDMARAGDLERARAKMLNRVGDTWEVLLLARESVRQRVLFL